MQNIITDEEIYNRMKTGWNSGRPTMSPCGSGSELNIAGKLLPWLEKIVNKYNIKVVNDAGAGDLKWISHCKWDVDYQGYDLYPRHKDVIELDFTKEIMRPCDLILCRQVLIHLPQDRILRALDLFRKSGKYLAATNYHSPQKHRLDSNAPFHHTRLTDEIYGLGTPIESIPDTNNMNDLSVWKLNK